MCTHLCVCVLVCASVCLCVVVVSAMQKDQGQARERGGEIHGGSGKVSYSDAVSGGGVGTVGSLGRAREGGELGKGPEQHSLLLAE